ncbi:acidic leucine-rich nuclear phosphoprotein 32-related protein-like [Zingiber officinale]|nr:acidic leucine-rich nuclear phosphoprotein 32-related protein-like [Zingiber officinale]XP_042473432.1 acidic leucine-rich nuclear phosphoprotein 32-related protein-like [Zingiber officinale]
MDEAWERAVEAAIGAQAESSSSASPPRSLTLDGSVKCLHGRLPPPEILERYQSLEVLSIANIGVSSLEKFPRLQNLQRLILSDNRIGGGLEFLVEAGMDSLRDLDLSNNRIQFLEDLSPLAQLRLVSLDLYECPVTRVKDYRSRVFGMIRTLKYLDKLDADENERPESDEEEEEEEEEEDEEEDPGSGEVDGEEHAERLMNGVASNTTHAVVDADEEEESDAEEEDTETGMGTDANGLERGYHASNGFRVAPIRAASVEREEGQDEEEDVDEYDEEDDLGEEIDAEEEEEEEEEDDVVEVHDIRDSEEEDEDGVDEGEEELDEEDEDGDVEEDQDIPDDEDDGEPGSSGRFINGEGEIDGHEQGEGDEDENGEIGQEDEQDVDDDRFSEEGDGEDEFEDDDNGGEYLVQQIPQPLVVDTAGSDTFEEDEDDEVDNDDDGKEHLQVNNKCSPRHASSSQPNKRRRDDDNGDEESEEEQQQRPKHHHP